MSADNRKGLFRKDDYRRFETADSADANMIVRIGSNPVWIRLV